MNKRSVHVVPAKTGWSVRKSGASRASKTFATKKEAMAYGISAGKKDHTELFVHKKDGRINERRSYGNDPCPPIDKDHQ